MIVKKSFAKTILNHSGNIVFFGLLLLFMFNTNAKSWLLERLVDIGLFNAEIKKDTPKIEDQNALSFSYYNTGGQLESTSNLKGKVVFINFWATWCPPCRAEMPSLNHLYNNLKNNNNFVFLFINEDEDLHKAKLYLKKYGYDIPLYVSSGTVPRQIFSGTLPTTVVLDKNGKTVLKKEGLAGYNNQAFIQQLKELL